ncbi:MAG: hypothetical protein RR351_03510, partial [Christensenella sp.]
ANNSTPKRDDSAVPITYKPNVQPSTIISKTVKLDPPKETKVTDSIGVLTQKRLDRTGETEQYQTQYENYADEIARDEDGIMEKSKMSAAALINGIPLSDEDQKKALADVEAANNWMGKRDENKKAVESIKSNAYKQTVQGEIDNIQAEMNNDQNAGEYIEIGKKNKGYLDLEDLSKGGGWINNPVLSTVTKYGSNLIGSYTAKEKGTQITQTDLDMVAYLAGSDQTQRANRYIYDILDRQLDARASAQKTKEVYDSFGGDTATDAQELGAAVTSVVLSPQKALGAVAGIGQSIKNMVTGGYEDINTNSAAYQGTKSNNAMRELAVKDLDDGQKFLANAAMGIGDMLAALPFGSWIAPAIMAGGVMSDSTLQAAENGASAEQATLVGVVNGIAAYATEKIGFDKIFATHAIAKNLGKNGFKQFVAAAAQNAAVEGMEEITEETINIVSDMAILGDKGEVQNYANEYIKNSPNATKADKDVAMATYLLERLGAAGLGGAISGGVLGGTSNIIGSAQHTSATGKGYN